jgi:hypothetical protein
VNGAADIVTHRGRAFAALGFTVKRAKSVAIDIPTAPARLRCLDLVFLNA